jgi:hypothetical protein
MKLYSVVAGYPVERGVWKSSTAILPQLPSSCEWNEQDGPRDDRHVISMNGRLMARPPRLPMSRSVRGAEDSFIPAKTWRDARKALEVQGLQDTVLNAQRQCIAI